MANQRLDAGSIYADVVVRYMAQVQLKTLFALSNLWMARHQLMAVLG